MKDEKPSTEVLIAPQLAVQRYLDELLQDATVNVEAVPDVENDSVSEELADEKQAEEFTAQDKTDAEIKHDQQDEFVLHEIENEEDAFAAFEFAVAALENETETVGSKPVSEPETALTNEAVAENDLDVERELVVENELLQAETDATVVEAPALVETVEQEAKLAKHTQETVVVEPTKEETSDIEPEAVSDKTKPLPWAESRFECLLFNVGGLKMAVPLVELGGIQKADYEKVTKIFGQPNWFIGVSSVNDLRIRTVDTAQWVMPNHYKGELHDSFKFIIQLDRSNWGLACEEVAEAISLEPSEVKWRSDRSKRPWLAGTVIDHMCAILDVQGFIELLDDPKNGFKAHLK